MQIRLVYYPDVFKAIKNAQLDVDLEIYMEELLLPIHTMNNSGKEYNDQMTKVRKCIEIIFLSMAQHGLLPNKKQGEKVILHNILVDKRGGINNTWCSMIIAGLDVKKGDNIIIKSTKNILPNVLKDSFQRLIEISAAYEHAENKGTNEEQQKNSRQTSSFLDNIDNAPYLLRGMVMELCNIILWYAAYLDEHGDEEINALNWDVLKT